LVHVPTVGVPTLVHVPVLRVPEVQQGDGDETEAVALGLGQRFATLVLVDGDGEVRGVAHVTLRVAHLGAADQDAVGPAGATPHKAVATIAAGGRHRGPSAARQAAHRVRHLAHRGAHKAAKHGHARHHHSHRGSHRASHRHG
jgi:hypothetical protein